MRAVSSSGIGGATVTAVDSTTGNVCTLSTCTTTTSSEPNTLGQYTLTVPGNNTYVITVSSMRAIVTVGTGSGTQVTVNPVSEAAVEILETKNLNVPAGTLGKTGHRFDSTINGVDVNGDVQTRDQSGEPTAVAQAVLTALESCLPPQGAAGVENALSHIQSHHHGNGHGGGHDSGTGTSSGTDTGTGTSSGTDTGTVTTTSSGTDTSTSSGTGTGTGSGGGLDSGNDHFCHRGGSGTGTSSNTSTTSGTGTDTGTSTTSGTGTDTGTSTTSGTGTDTGTSTTSNTGTSTTSGTGTGTSVAKP
ncbi:MAG: hypothetical protein HY098_05980 [Nitrospinae bacterium]|nr:hypothetical protein [Nitrospinota bacterium]